VSAISSDCTVWFDLPSRRNSWHEVAQKVNTGSVCAMWTLHARRAFESRDLEDALEHGLDTDLLVVNGGLHYPCYHSTPGSVDHELFERDLRTFVNSTSHLMRTSLPHLKRVFVSSTSNQVTCPGAIGWTLESSRYLLMKRLLMAARDVDVALRSFYIPLHEMAHVDRCGFSHRFRNPLGWKRLAEPDACGNNRTYGDIHLSGSAYVHLADLELGWAVACHPPAPSATSSSDAK